MAAWGSPKVCTTLQIISVFILSVQRSVLRSRRDAACEYYVPTTVPFHSERAATMRNCKAKVPASPRAPLLSLCGRRLMQPNPGAAVGGMRRADGAPDPRDDGAPGPPGGSPVPGREAAVGTKRHADSSTADGAGAGAPTPHVFQENEDYIQP